MGLLGGCLWFQADIININLDGLKGNFIRKRDFFFTSNVANIPFWIPESEPAAKQSVQQAENKQRWGFLLPVSTSLLH